MGKCPFSSRRSSSRRRRPKSTTVPQPSIPPPIGTASSSSSPPPSAGNLVGSGGAAGKGKKKKKAAGARLWMRFDTMGISELVEYDKSMIIRRASITARDLRILGPIFSHSSTILAREKAMVVNLEFIKAIITAEEVLILDPLQHEALQFVDQLRQQLPHKSAFKIQGAGAMDVNDS